MISVAFVIIIVIVIVAVVAFPFGYAHDLVFCAWNSLVKTGIDRIQKMAEFGYGGGNLKFRTDNVPRILAFG